MSFDVKKLRERLKASMAGPILSSNLTERRAQITDQLFNLQLVTSNGADDTQIRAALKAAGVKFYPFWWEDLNIISTILTCSEPFTAADYPGFQYMYVEPDKFYKGFILWARFADPHNFAERGIDIVPFHSALIRLKYYQVEAEAQVPGVQFHCEYRPYRTPPITWDYHFVHECDTDPEMGPYCSQLFWAREHIETVLQTVSLDLQDNGDQVKLAIAQAQQYRQLATDRAKLERARGNKELRKKHEFEARVLELVDLIKAEQASLDSIIGSTQ